MTGVLRSVYVDMEVEEKLNQLAFYFQCPKHVIMDWAIRYATPALEELMRKAKDPEKLVEQFKQRELDTPFNRELRAAKRRDIKRLNAAIEEVVLVPNFTEDQTDE